MWHYPNRLLRGLEEKLPNLFKPFNRLGMETSTIEGTGIGLSIAKHLVELMGGTIGVESIPGKGSCFYIDMSLVEKHIPVEKKSETTKSDSIQEVSKNKKLILYVEDDMTSQTLVKVILKRRPNIKLQCVSQVQLGIELACAHRPDLILMDINMPEIDGFEALKRLKAQKNTKDIPVMALSSDAMPKSIEKGLIAGFVYYLTKPINIFEFLEKVDSVLRKSHNKVGEK